jgi:hypothetical protein
MSAHAKKNAIGDLHKGDTLESAWTRYFLIKVGCIVVFTAVMFAFSCSMGKKSEISEDFESGKFESTVFSSGSIWTSGWIVESLEMVISGEFSVYGKADSKSEWSEFLYSDIKKLRLERKGSYTVMFNYKAVKAPGADGGYYFLARSTTGGISNDKAFTKWTDTEGSVGSKIIDLTLGDFDDYYLIWGIYRGGALAIDNIDIMKRK